MSPATAEKSREQEALIQQLREGSTLEQEEIQHDLRRRLLKLILDCEQHRKNQYAGFRI